MNPPIQLVPPPRDCPVPALPALRAREERLQALQQLAGRLAHDFSNFLVPIFGYLALMKEDLPAGSHTAEYATALEAAARETEGKVHAALAATRPRRRFRPRPFDLGPLVEAELARWAASLPPTAGISIQRELAPCPMVGDDVQWRRVLEQLLANARFGLATGGTLEVRLEPQTLATETATDLGVAETATHLLTLQDNGFGMPAAVAEQAFDPFFSTRGKSQGLGLGLTFVYSVVRLHGGQVVLESVEDGGTTVRLWVPAAQREQAAVAPTPPPAPADAKVLLVADDPLVLEVVGARLQAARFEVHVARDGRAGLDLYRRFTRQWALILSELALPVIDGATMVERIRELEPEANLICFSSGSEVDREAALARLGRPAPVLLRKPFTLKHVMEVVRARLADHSSGSVSKKPCN